jgi:hypothetical protein
VVRSIASVPDFFLPERVVGAILLYGDSPAVFMFFELVRVNSFWLIFYLL